MKLFSKSFFLHLGIMLASLCSTFDANAQIGTLPNYTINYGETKIITITPTKSTANPVFSALTSGTKTSCRIVSSTRNTVTYEGLYPTSSSILCKIYISQDGDGVTPPATKEVPITVNKAPQVITPTQPSKLVVDGTVELPYTISSGLNVVATSATPAVCAVTSPASETPIIIKGLLATPPPKDKCKITLKQDGNEYYLQAPSKDVLIHVDHGTRTITFTNPPETIQYRKPFLLELTKSVNVGAISGSTSTGSICTVTNASTGTTDPTKISVTGIGLGVCTVVATIPMDDKYSHTKVEQTITITKADQKLSFTRDTTGNVNPGVFDILTLKTDNPGGMADPSAPVNVSVSDINICTIMPNPSVVGEYWVWTVRPGVCQVTATQQGNVFYNPGTTSLNIGIDKHSQTVGIKGTKEMIVDEEITLTITPGGSTALVSLVTNDISLCKLTQAPVQTPPKITYKLQAVRGGSCIITAKQSGDELFNDAVTQPYIVTIKKKIVPIVFDYTPNLKVGTTDAISAIGSIKNTTGTIITPVKFKTSTPGCEVITDLNGILPQKIKGNKFGTNNCTIEASRDEDDFNMAAGPVYQTFSVYKGPQEIAFSALPSSINVGSSIAISATGAPSGSQLSLSVTENGPCSIVVDAATSTDKRTATVTANNKGNCVITAQQGETVDYEAGAQSAQMSIKNKQILTFTNPLPVLVVNDVKSIGATSTNNTIPVILTSQNTNVCTLQSEVVNNVTTYKVRAVNATGTQLCTIVANQAGNADYDAATEISVMLNIGKANQIISFLPLTNARISDQNRLITASTDSGLPISFSAAPASICTIDTTNTVNFVKAGLCKITASQAGNANYNGAASIVQDLQILPPASSTTLTSSSNPVMIRKNVTLTATITGTNPGGAVSFIADGIPITNCNSVIVTASKATCTTSKLKTGKRSIVASYSGDANNDASQSVPLVQTVKSLDWLMPLLNELLN